MEDMEGEVLEFMKDYYQTNENQLTLSGILKLHSPRKGDIRLIGNKEQIRNAVKKLENERYIIKENDGISPSDGKPKFTFRIKEEEEL